MSQDPYGQPDPYRTSGYEDYSQGLPPAQPAPYSEPTYQNPMYQQAPASPYPQPGYADPTYAQPYPQPGYGLAPYAIAFDATARSSVTMPQAVKLWLKNWKNFSGRASRSEFWWVELALAIASMILTVVLLVFILGVAAVSGGSDTGITFAMLAMFGIIGLASLAVVIPTLALSVRRLHDTNQSGWMYLISLVPYVGGIILLILLAQPSNPAGAQYDDRSQPLFGPENL